MTTTPAATRPDSYAASWDEYLALGEDVRAEYIDGKVVMTPSPTQLHQRLSWKLAQALDEVLPVGSSVNAAWAWKPGRDEFIPDVIVYPATDESARFTGTPDLVVEVLSTNRRDDLVRKVQKYARAGAPRYWIIDPADATFDAFALQEDGTYEPVVHLEDGESADVDLGVAVLHVDVRAMLA